jgi:ribosomal-protein-alanine N-acetyltransferase
VELATPSCVLRPWEWGDAVDVMAAANHREIARNLTDVFPHPYTLQDAEDWLALCLGQKDPPVNLAVVIDGRVVGGIGGHRLEGTYGHIMNVGYWLAPDRWGRGIATDALGAYVGYLFDTFDVDRLQSSVFGWNPASARVLEKCGFRLEGRRRDAICKFGEVTDELLYGLLRSDLEAVNETGA